MALVLMLEWPSPDGFCIHAWIVKPWWLLYSCLSCQGIMAFVFMLELSGPDGFCINAWIVKASWLLYSFLSGQALMAFAFMLQLSSHDGFLQFINFWLSPNGFHVCPSNLARPCFAFEHLVHWSHVTCWVISCFCRITLLTGVFNLSMHKLNPYT